MVEVEHCLDEVVAAVLLARVHRMADLGNQFAAAGEGQQSMLRAESFEQNHDICLEWQRTESAEADGRSLPLLAGPFQMIHRREAEASFRDM